ncbi:Na+-driven multidrug efflux pump [Sphaerochaeta pleomorpha str. Grapes]|uniref:Multidrug export protein MepA n=1 Tax=Sphaerochaeta pleomorpha (strain ATCC BAA-1885 / DSM 22778 / Grapes) TaxID=158190 RepID=G8QW05_SPHPG|nr:MATE family efflux transporter [Sphaerochaeta pleomorpha]AEV30529.1 Na+-driven multidrug efflux pump [Sphaerochaeta pleomorpha str. Grapes]
METHINTIHNTIAANFTLKSLLRFTLPTVTMMLFMGLYTMVDSILISRFIGTDGLSALNIITPVINLIVGFGGMFATGTNAIVARELGEGNTNRASQDFSLLVITAIVAGIGIAIAGTLWKTSLIQTLGSNKVLFPYCNSYLSVLLFFTPAAIMQILFQHLLVTAGKPGVGLMVSVGAGILNILLDILFIVEYKMGIAGAALGTGLAYTFPSLVGIAVFIQKDAVLTFCRPIIDFHVIIKSCKNGFSELVSQSAMAVTTFLFNITMMKLAGETGVAAITIMIYAQFLVTSIYIGFSMGVSPILSFNYGSHNSPRLTRIFSYSFWIIGIFSGILFICSQLYGPVLVSFFTDTTSPVYHLASTGFRIFSSSFLCSGFTIFASATFTAFSDWKRSAIISCLRSFICLVIALMLFPRIWQETGVWLAVPFSEFASLLASLILLHKFRHVYNYCQSRHSKPFASPCPHEIKS